MLLVYPPMAEKIMGPNEQNMLNVGKLLVYLGFLVSPDMFESFG